MGDNKMKWVCTFALMGFIGWWGYYTVMVTYRALAELQAVNVMEVAGASGLLGALITLLTLAIQYWFRKANPSSSCSHSEASPMPSERLSRAL